MLANALVKLVLTPGKSFSEKDHESSVDVFFGIDSVCVRFFMTLEHFSTGNLMVMYTQELGRKASARQEVMKTLVWETASIMISRS